MLNFKLSASTPNFSAAIVCVWQAEDQMGKGIISICPFGFKGLSSHHAALINQILLEPQDCQKWEGYSGWKKRIQLEIWLRSDAMAPMARPVETTLRCGVRKAWAVGRSYSKSTACAERGPSHPACASNARPLLGTRSPLQSRQTACERGKVWSRF